MDERDFFLEARAQRTASLNCPFCRNTNEYSLTWLFRKKRTNINVNQLDERDRAKFEKAQSYMVLLDDHATCAEPGCRRRFEVSGVKTMAFVTPEQLEEVSFGQEGRRDAGIRGQGRDRGYRQQGGRGQENRGNQDSRGNRGEPGNRWDSGNRGTYGNREGQRERGAGQYGEGGKPGGGAPGNRGKQPGNRGGNTNYSPTPSPWNDPQGPRGPRGKRSDPTGPGGGWR
jgi:hypothetical protein